MLIVCNEIKKKYLDFKPELVVEILSPVTALKDRHTKYDIYDSQRIKYYLIIDPDSEQTEIYELGDKKKKYSLEEKGHDFQYIFSFDKCNPEINFMEI